MRDIIGHSDVVMITLDTLRYDVAQAAWRDGDLKGLAPYLGPDGWEERHSPGSFTYAAHHAFFSGFLPTPIQPGNHPRPFAAEFAGSTTVSDSTFLFREATLPEALARHGYSTVCIGGTGFFNQQNALSKVLPGLFQEAVWESELGVTNPRSQVHQVDRALSSIKGKGKVFLFLNMAAIHQPNWFYASGKECPDNLNSHRAALLAVDEALIRLWDELKRRGPAFVIICSDHGTCYGESGYTGHRVGHQIVWTVPYKEFRI